MKSNEVAFQLRINNILYAKIKYIAKTQHRSINQQISYVLDLFIQDHENSNGAIQNEEIEKILNKLNQ